MLANILVKYFEAGGPIMWPILITAIVAVAVVGERTFWWGRESRKRDPHTLEKVFAALENGDFREAARLSKDSEDPAIRVIWHGMNHFHSSLQGAEQWRQRHECVHDRQEPARLLQFDAGCHLQ